MRLFDIIECVQEGIVVVMSIDGYGNTGVVTSEGNDYLHYLNRAINNIRCANDFNRVARKVNFFADKSSMQYNNLLVKELQTLLSFCRSR